MMFVSSLLLLLLFKGCQSCDETPYIRKYLYVGGEYAGNGKDEHIFRDQMYVEHLAPAKGPTKQHPIVLFHGQAQTGTVSGSPKVLPWRERSDGDFTRTGSINLMAGVVGRHTLLSMATSVT